MSGRRYQMSWASPSGKRWFLSSSGAYIYQQRAVGLRSNTAIGCLATVTDILGARLDEEYTVFGGTLVIGSYDVVGENGKLRGTRTAAVWSTADVGLWTDVEFTDSAWIIDLYEHLGPTVLDGAAIAGSASPDLWTREGDVVLATVPGLGLLEVGKRAPEDMPSAVGIPAPAGMMFRGTDPQEPSLVLLGDSVVVNVSMLETMPDEAVKTLHSIESLSTDRVGLSR